LTHLVLYKTMISNTYRIVVVGGWCGNLLYIVADHLQDILTDAGFSFRLTTHSVWNSFTQPPPCDLVLQLLPAFTAEEINCPVINIRRLLVERNHPETLEKVFKQVRADFSEQI
jgi:hypothetical protein